MNPKEKMTCGVGIASPPFIVRRLTVGTESSDTVSVSNGETAAINEATERRRRIAFALLDALTKIGSELHADDVPHFRLVAEWFGGRELVDRLLSSYDQKAKGRGISLDRTELQEEVLLSIAVT